MRAPFIACLPEVVFYPGRILLPSHGRQLVIVIMAVSKCYILYLPSHASFVQYTVVLKDSFRPTVPFDELEAPSAKPSAHVGGRTR